MDHKEMLRDLKKLKFTPTDLYLLALRQILLNQREILLATSSCGIGRPCSGFALANDTADLVKRLEEFIENKQ